MRGRNRLSSGAGSAFGQWRERTGGRDRPGRPAWERPSGAAREDPATDVGGGPGRPDGTAQASLGKGTQLAGKDKTQTQHLDGMEFLEGPRDKGELM